MDFISWTIFFLISIVWGASFLFNEILLTSFSPHILVFYRLLFGFFTIFIIRTIWKQPPLIMTNLPYWIILACLNNVFPFILIVLGQQYIDSGTASIFNAFTPFSVLILAHIFTQDEKIKPHKFLGLLIAIIGIAIVANVSNISLQNHNLVGGAMVLIASVCYGISAIIIKKMPQDSPVNNTLMMLLCGCVMLAPFSIQIPDIVKFQDINIVISYFFIGVLGTGCVYILIFFLFKRTGATNTSLITLVIPVFAMIFGTLILNEILEISDILGILLISTGILLINGQIMNTIKKQ